MILGLPIPQLILADNPKKRGAFIVIDGKQRLLAIKRFGSSDSQGDFKPLKLKGLQILSQLEGMTYTDMQANEKFAEDRNAFENASIRTIIIRNVQKEEYLYEVFLRINTGSVQLAPQELRQALHPGKFSTFIGEASGNSTELRRALKLSEPDFRMRDAEIMLRFFAYRFFMNKYNGNLKVFLDNTTRDLNNDWDMREREILDAAQEMEEALRFTRETFSEESYLRKWNGTEFESRKNRAVFDIMLHYFSFQEVRNHLAGKENGVVQAFKTLCESDEFRVSLETTTKSLEANRTRFNLWAAALEKLTGLDLSALKFPG